MDWVGYEVVFEFRPSAMDIDRPGKIPLATTSAPSPLQTCINTLIVLVNQNIAVK